MTNGVVDIQSNVPFPVILANFASKAVSLSKNQVIGHAMPQDPTEILSIESQSEKNPDEEGVGFVPINQLRYREQMYTTYAPNA